MHRIAALEHRAADPEAYIQAPADAMEKRILDAVDTRDAAECHKKFQKLIPRLAEPPGRLVDRGVVNPRQRQRRKGDRHKGHDSIILPPDFNPDKVRDEREAAKKRKKNAKKKKNKKHADESTDSGLSLEPTAKKADR